MPPVRALGPQELQARPSRRAEAQALLQGVGLDAGQAAACGPASAARLPVLRVASRRCPRVSGGEGEGQAVTDPILIADLIRADVPPDLVGRVAAALAAAEARAEGALTEIARVEADERAFEEAKLARRRERNARYYKTHSDVLRRASRLKTSERQRARVNANLPLEEPPKEKPLPSAAGTKKNPQASETGHRLPDD